MIAGNSAVAFEAAGRIAAPVPTRTLRICTIELSQRMVSSAHCIEGNAAESRIETSSQ